MWSDINTVALCFVIFSPLLALGYWYWWRVHIAERKRLEQERKAREDRQAGRIAKEPEPAKSSMIGAALHIVLFWGGICGGIGHMAAEVSGWKGSGYWIVGATVGLAAFLAPFAFAKRLTRKTGGSAKKALGKIFGYIFTAFLLLLWLGLCFGMSGGLSDALRLGGRAKSTVILGGGLFLFVAPIAFLYLWITRKFRAREIVRVMERSNQGDPDGAIEELRAIIDFEGPSSIRWSTLGTLLSMRERWSEAIAAFVEAEKSGKPDATTLSNHANALESLDRNEEAFELRRQAYTLQPNDVLNLAGYARQLARFGRIDEARIALERAEEGWRNTIFLSASFDRGPIDSLLADCRAFVEQSAPTKEDFRALEEL